MAVHLFLLALGLATPGAAAHPQGRSSQQEKLSCSTFPADKHSGKKELWDGYEVSVGPTAHFKDGSHADDACTAAIYDRFGNEVYRTTGPGVLLDPATGMDIDGDGAPEVVLMNGSGGGSRGSWTIEVVSLKPQPHLLFKLEGYSPPAPFRKDSQQRVVWWSWDRIELGNLGHYEFSSATGRFYAQRVYRFTDGEVREVSAGYYSEIEKSLPRPTKNEMEDLKESKIDSGQFENLDNEEAASKVLSLLIQNIFCRRFKEALDFIHQTWPEHDQANLIKVLKENFERWDCPECAKEIAQWR
jgi:hypothetical protein